MASHPTIPHGDSLAIENLTSLAALSALETEWRELFEEQQSATPFQHPDWVLPWARRFVPHAIWAWAFRSVEGRLVGLVPSFRYEREGQRIIAMMGGGHSDRHDLLAPPAWANTVARAFFEELQRFQNDWDLCELEQLSELSPLLHTPLPTGLLEYRREPHEPCPVLPLPEKGAPLSLVIPGHQLARYRKYRRRAERIGTLRLVRATKVDAKSHFESFLRLHGARWKMREGCGQPPVVEHRDFHAEVVDQASRSGSLRLYLLRIGQRGIASLYGFISKTTLSCYAQGLDPEASPLSPGLLLVGAVLEDAWAEGATAVDFLRGEEPYKLQWGAKSQPTYRRTVRSRAFRGPSL